MKTIIAGSRNINDYSILHNAIDKCGFEVSEILSGCATGVDTLAIKFAKLNSYPLHKYPADWEGLGKAAGFIRNRKMADNAEALIAIWDGNSKGTKHMIKTALDKGLRVYIHY